ncbi:MAG: sugar transferase [Eggerthellaceae bacterium]|nr:sugar transferase [Eggerthellaceae bacterium]
MKREDLTKVQRWAIANRLAEERLPCINANLADVIPSGGLYVRYGKRTIDVVVSGAALVVTLPINAIIGVATFFDVGCPIIFKQVRVGKDEKPFQILKFRNMRNTTDEKGELLPPSQRVTKFGKFVRRTSLDELLNFWSVFKGDMSLIGPRPLLPEYTHRYNKRHRMRLAVRPGLECPPREFDGHVWTWQEQLDNDVWYVENLSFKTDCKMFANLVRFTFDRKSAAARAVSKRGMFMGYSEEGVAINLQEVPQEYVDAVEAIEGAADE